MPPDIGDNDIPFSDDGLPLNPGPAPDAASPSIAALLGAQGALVAAVGQRAAEVFAVGLESVVAQKGTVRSSSAGIAQPAGLVAEFTGVDYLAIEVRLALSETEAHPLAVLVRLEDVSRLFMLDLSPDQMADDAFAQGQLEVVSAGMRELLDLAGLMLFIDDLAGGEMTLSTVRLHGIEETLAIIDGTAPGMPPVRAEITIELPDGSDAVIVALLPTSLLMRLADRLSAPAQSPVEAAPPRAEAPGLHAVGGMGGPGAASAASAASPAGQAAGAPPEFPGFSQVRMGGGRTAEPEVAVHPVRFPSLSPSDGLAALPQQFDLIMDVPLRVSVELGRSSMTVEDVLALGPGSVVELNKLAGEPVDVLVNDRLVARGEVVVVDENFGVRVTEVLSPRTRANALTR